MSTRGEIYVASLDPAEGREQSGYRPALVVSSDAINRPPPVCDCAGRNRNGDCGARLTGAAGQSGREVARRGGQQPPARVAEVDEAVKMVLNLG